jgi:predicted RND superfamily exporter protein
MSNEVISMDGKDVVVRDDTAKAFRWRKFAVIVLSGIIAIFIVSMLFFSGVLSAVDSNPNAANAAENRNPGP